MLHGQQREMVGAEGQKKKKQHGCKFSGSVRRQQEVVDAQFKTAKTNEILPRVLKMKNDYEGGEKTYIYDAEDFGRRFPTVGYLLWSDIGLTYSRSRFCF